MPNTSSFTISLRVTFMAEHIKVASRTSWLQSTRGFVNIVGPDVHSSRGTAGAIAAGVAMDDVNKLGAGSVESALVPEGTFVKRARWIQAGNPGEIRLNS